MVVSVRAAAHLIIDLLQRCLLRLCESHCTANTGRHQQSASVHTAATLLARSALCREALCRHLGRARSLQSFPPGVQSSAEAWPLLHLLFLAQPPLAHCCQDSAVPALTACARASAQVSREHIHPIMHILHMLTYSSSRSHPRLMLS